MQIILKSDSALFQLEDLVNLLNNKEIQTSLSDGKLSLSVLPDAKGKPLSRQTQSRDSHASHNHDLGSNKNDHHASRIPSGWNKTLFFDQRYGCECRIPRYPLSYDL